ncbi:hypothetical protein OG21DRAFT_1607530 [Imleria badia]|nr:hypothetical protein OG21DRAFT_1607530 [Imleria badia]
MRISLSFVSFALYLSFAAAAVMPNVDITSRDGVGNVEGIDTTNRLTGETNNAYNTSRLTRLAGIAGIAGITKGITSKHQPKKDLVRTVKRTSNLEAPIISLSRVTAVDRAVATSSIPVLPATVQSSSVGDYRDQWRSRMGALWRLDKRCLESRSARWLSGEKKNAMMEEGDERVNVRAREERWDAQTLRSAEQAAMFCPVPNDARTCIALTECEVREGDGEGSKQSVVEVGYPVTGVRWNTDEQHVYMAALEDEIHVYDVKKNQEVSPSRDTPAPRMTWMSCAGTLRGANQPPYPNTPLPPCRRESCGCFKNPLTTSYDVGKPPWWWSTFMAASGPLLNKGRGGRELLWKRD